MLKSNITAIRHKIRHNKFSGATSGLAPGFLQGNVVILPSAYAHDFLDFCQLNPKPCPVVGVSNAGDWTLPLLGDIDIRTDVPEYYIFANSKRTKVYDINDYWQDDFVSIILGCSYSFENALIKAGYKIRNIDNGVSVSMYDSNIATNATKYFNGNMVVSMRPFNSKDVAAVIKITKKFTKAHGGPIHVGDAKKIGINNIDNPDYGDRVEIKHDETPIFWGCGVTSQRILQKANLPFYITHVPGKMLITDISHDHL